MSGELGVATLEAGLDVALTLGARALAHAETSGRAVLAGAAFEAEALVLGALQREVTLRERSPAQFDVGLERRVTTGTEAQLSGPVLYHALALPRVDTLYPDASARTLLNRNLRALLRGYTAAGVPLRYFGTEVLALLGRPVALVGYDQTASGAVLLEVFVGLENACVVRSALKRELPASLWSMVASRPPPMDLLSRVTAGVVERLGASAVDVSSELPPAPSRAVPDWDDATPARVAIPLGVVEATLEPRVRLTGDLLIGRAALAAVEQAADAVLAAQAAFDEQILRPLEGAALDGARPGDLLTALRAAQAG
ncbi:MAG TPA: hypothetical protein VIW29_22820 [Polyangiaceae bacterium]